jgi:MFS family permease
MTIPEEARPKPSAWLARLPFYPGWVQVVLAALAMTATLPGRTHGLGMISKPLTEDPSVGVDEVHFSALNFWAILLGSALCLPIGRLIDRVGTRLVLVGVALGLGLAVLGMSTASGTVLLFVTLLLIRGLGQGALSVVSMALVGKWFTRRLGPAMGVFSVLLAVGFIASTVGLGEAVKWYGWRAAWAALGWLLLLGLAPLGALLARSTPEALGLPVEADPVIEKETARDLPLGTALRSPAFWAFTLAAALFNLTWSAITLFNESILSDHGLGKDTFILVMAVLVFSGLPTNLIAGWLSTRWSMGRLLAVGMVVLALSLAGFPWVATTWQAVYYATGLGIAGGIVTVVFFAIYGHAFGRRHLGAIQAVVQVISVLASALGPLLLTSLKAWTGSYETLFSACAVLALVLALSCWVVELPGRSAEMTRVGEVSLEGSG